MDYKEFTENIAETLREKVGDGYTVTVTEVLKNNGVSLTGVVIMKESENVSPTIYLEEPYRQYQSGDSLSQIAEEVMAEYEKNAHSIKLDVDFFRSFPKVEDRIFHKIINYEKNKELLKDMPHFRWHDLAVVFYYSFEETMFGKASIAIHNSHLDMWGQTADEIYRIARRNMEQKMPEMLVPMSELVEELAGIKLEESEAPLYVLTNREKMFGASAVLYSEKIKELSDKLHSDLLILPSSVHETLLLPDDRKRGYDFYRKMVEEVNTTQVDSEEILSFNLYRYDREKEKIEMIAA